MTRDSDKPVPFYKWYAIVQSFGQYEGAIDCPEGASVAGFAAEALRSAVHTPGDLNTHALIQAQCAIDDYIEYCRKHGEA